MATRVSFCLPGINLWRKLNKRFQLKCITVDRRFQQNNPSADDYLEADHGYDYVDRYNYIDLDSYYCSINADEARPLPCHKRRESRSTLSQQSDENMFGNLFHCDEGNSLDDNFQSENDSYQPVSEGYYEIDNFRYLTTSSTV